MLQLSPLIQDLAIILMTAGLTAILLKKIGQPIVLGYILAGFLVNSHIWLLPTVKDVSNIQTWADIGVIFLLFALGLEFSFKKLLHVGVPSSITAIFEIVAMATLGFISGRLFDWSIIDSLFLGGILAISSTAIIVRTLHESGMKGRGFVEFVFGILIIEDLVAILLLVLLSTIALTNQLNKAELFFIAIKLLIFIILCFIFGIFILPSFFKLIRKFISEEILLIASLAFCFVMVQLSNNIGFSPALGAFIMGAILAETSEAKKIESLISPIKNFFASIFFVSVGMLINPKSFIQYWKIILILTFVTIAGKFFSIVIGSLISRRNLRHSIQAGLSLSQIGEFSFIIASLGISLKVTSNFLYPIAIGVSVITTIITPYLIRNIDAIYIWIEKLLPKKSLDILREKNKALEATNKYYNSIYAHIIFIILNTVVIITTYKVFEISNFPKNKTITLVIILIITSPFLWALLYKDNKQDNKIFIYLKITRIFIVIIFNIFLLTKLFSNNALIVIFTMMIMTTLFLSSSLLKNIYSKVEKHFINNFLDEKILPYDARLAPWDAHISYLDIPPESEIAGKTLHELKIRETFGASIVLIERGHLYITAPNRNEKLFPYDRIAVIGEKQKVDILLAHLKSTKTFTPNAKLENYGLHKILVEEQMSFSYKTIRKSKIHESTGGMIIGIERHGERILNPDSLLKILPNDLLWIVGDSKKIETLN